MKKLKKEILLTGASGAIGGAIARKLSREGYALHLTSRDPRKLSLLQEQLEEWGTPVRTSQLDLADIPRCQRVVDEFFAKARRPEGLICNAGDYGVLGSFAEIPFDDWRQTITVNFFSHAAMIHAFIKQVRVHRVTRPSIVVLSGAGLGGSATFAHATSYSTAKAALTHLVEALAPELLPLGVTINAISPGAVLSGMTDQALRAGDRAPAFAAAAKKCMETKGVSADLTAKLVLFLLGEKARGISGRLLSARFDQETLRRRARSVAGNHNLFRLRRIDEHLFAEGQK